MTDKPKKPRDANQLAKSVVDQATMDEKELAELRKKLESDKDYRPGKRGSSDRPDSRR